MNGLRILHRGILNVAGIGATRVVLPAQVVGIACLLILAGTAQAQTATESVRKAIVIGIDGLRPDQLRLADTPNLDAIATRGAINLTATNAWTPEQSWNGHSATNWGVLLTGVSPARSQLTANGDTEHLIRDTATGESTVRTLFGHLKNHDATIETGVFNTWGGIGPGRGTILEYSASFVDHHHHPTSDASPAQRDIETIKAVVDVLSSGGDYESADPDVVFVHLSQVDAAGHGHNYDAPEYRAAVENVDALVGMVVDAINDRSSRASEEWLMIVTSDHGGPDDAKNHADNGDRQVRTIPFIMCTDGASPAKVSGSPSLYDVTPTVLGWMGADTTAGRFDGRPLRFIEDDHSTESHSISGNHVGTKTRARTIAGEEPEDGGSLLDWWREARFGMFIHWGPVSLKGTEIGWSRGKQVPVEEYDNLYQRFNPTEFDADEWVCIAKAAGMKYIVITSKHHDGFCLWDSKHTDYDIMATPFGRDLLAELSQECTRQGIRFCVYYSICDWRHPDYPTDSPGGGAAKQSPDMNQYVRFMKSQLKELVENYGPLGLVWFDGDWEKPWTVERGDDLYRFMKSLQPDIIVNNRVNKARHGMAGTSRKDIANPGDYDTPEQQVGSFNRERPWETCMTICQQWAWKPSDQMKSLEQCLRTLIYVVGGDGNLLFNVGPMPDGRIEPRQVERLKEMGRWLDRFGEGIYDTRGGPFKPGKWGAATCRDNKVFLFVMRWPTEGPLMLPALVAKVESAELVTGGNVIVEQNGDSWSLWVEPEDRGAIATVVRFELDRSAIDITPIDVPRPPSESFAFGGRATASNIFRDMDKHGPVMAIDDDPDTRWATDAGTKSAWLAVDLGEVRTISRIVVVEGKWDRVRRYEVQVAQDDTWTTIADGDKLGKRMVLRFEPVVARRVRLHILDATEGPTIWEMQVFGE